MRSERCAGSISAATRAARRSTAMGLTAITAATGVDVAQIRGALNAVKIRGVCARTVVALTGVGGGAKLVGLTHRACPPAVTRLTAEALSPFECLALQGSARWAVQPSLKTTTQAECRLLAEHGGCPPKLVTLLARDDSWSIRAAVAARVGCAPELIVRLAHDTDADVRAAIAARADCPPHLIVRLATDTDEDVRAAIAARADCAPELLSVFAYGDRRKVRAAVAANVRCDPELVVRLAQDTDEDVLANIAARADCPPASAVCIRCRGLPRSASSDFRWSAHPARNLVAPSQQSGFSRRS